MYPRNAASPERIAVGPVVLIADGTVQTSGVSITVVPQGGTTAAGGGTISYEQGVVFYLPTQAETNYTSFIVTAYKASCIPVSVTVVTTSSATAGKVVLSGETHTSAVIPTVTTLTGHTAQTGDCFARLGAPAGASVSADVAAVQSDTNDIQTRLPAALVGGRIDASVGAMASGVVTAAAIATDAIDNDAIAADVTAVLADAVWNAATATYGSAGTYGALVETNLDAAVSSRSTYAGGAVASVTGAVGSVAAGVTVTTNNDKSGYSVSGLTASDVGAIKTKTDSLTFTVAGQVDANIQSINDVTITGNGGVTPFNIV